MSSEACGSCGIRFDSDEHFCGICGTQRDRLDGQEGELRDSQPRAEQDSQNLEEGNGVKSDSAVTPNVIRWTGEEKLASSRSRIIGVLVIQALGFVHLVPQIGILLFLGLTLWNFRLYRRGLDIGAHLVGMRVMRENGELAGFFHMWTRNIVSLLSFFAVGAGYWTAFSDKHRQTWHDKVMRTYVVTDQPEYVNRPGTSSDISILVFYISVALIIALSATLVGLMSSEISGG